MPLRRLVTASLIAAPLLVAVGCKRDHASTEAGQASKTTTTGADVRKLTDSALDRMAAARCRREVACDHVGPGRRHESRETCEALNRAEASGELGPSACPEGLDDTKVIGCIAAIESASCLDPVAAIVRVEDCRASKLCLRGNNP